MLRCREVSRLASKSLDAPLNWRERLGLGFHMMMCGACSRYRRQIRALHEALRSGVEALEDSDILQSITLTQEDRERMVRALSAEASGET